MIRKCHGCGAVMQSEKVGELGYTSLEKIKDSLYCERCFKIIHYNEKAVTKLDNINDKIKEEVNKKAKYVYFLVDLLNVNEETMNTFKSINVDKTLIISKVDIVPKSIKDYVIKEWLKSEYGIYCDVIFQSTKKNFNTKALLRNLAEKGVNECYILGFTNAGKSTLINKISSFSESEKAEIATSLIPNTTVDFIEINNCEGIKIIDSPGFTLEKTIYADDEFALMKRVNPRNIIKPVTYQVKEISSILIEDKIRLQSNVKNSLTFYMSNDVLIERVFPNNVKLKDKECFILDIPNNSDLVIRSLGFINIKKACKLEINSDLKELFEVRKSMFRD